MNMFDAADLQAVNPTNAQPAPPSGTFDPQMIDQINQPQAPAQQSQAAPPIQTLPSLGILSGPVGLAETAANWATGMLGQAAGGWRELVGLGTGENLSSAVQQGQKWQKALTYQPVTQAGSELSQLPSQISGGLENFINQKTHTGAGTVITHPGEALGQEVFNKTGSPFLGSLASAMPSAATLLLGFKTPTEETLAGAIPEDTAKIEPSLGTAGAEKSATASAERPISGVGAAQYNPNPYSLSGMDDSRGPYSLIKMAKIPEDVSPEEQQARAQIAARILENPERIRSGVLTGNIDTLRNEYEQARSANPTPAGQILRQKIADEQNSLTNFAEHQVAKTGALPQFVDDYQRGDYLNSVMYGQDGIKGLIDSAKKNVYDQAMQVAGTQPVNTLNFDALRNSPQFAAELQLAGQKDFLGGISNLADMAKTQGFDGAPAGSVASLERLRQSINRQWTPQNRYFIRQAVSAIDNDVAGVGGPGLLEQARGIHQAEQTLFGSKGIKTLFGDVDPNGVQTATSFDDIPKKLNNLPTDQFNHIYNTFDSVSNGFIPGTNIAVPQDLQVAAQQAKNEIAGSLVREVASAGGKNVGMWNANAANNVLNARASKLSAVLSPDQQEAMHTLNIGGQIMPAQFSYEGAAQQAKRMGEAGLFEKAAPQIGASIGGTLPIPGAEWLGGKIGEKLGGNVRLSRLMKDARALDAQMEANAKLGKGKE